MATTIRIKFFMDYICEWCCLGYRILQQLADEYDFDLELYPLEIHPDAPERGMPMDWHIDNKEEWMLRMNQLGAPYGITFKDKYYFANTHNALIMGQYAKTHNKHREYTDLLWRIYMEEGRNISDRKVIEEIAYRLGFTMAQVEEAFTSGIYEAAMYRNKQYHQSFGTDQVPCFVVNEEYIMIGAQSADTWRELFAQIEKEQSAPAPEDYE